ncbi:hypothetical protein HYS91_00375 [Candidatus Daviesbacteria bacterium]|nr:hypothetical protein [Candidatus Daviesbacteria bacterium]
MIERRESEYRGQIRTFRELQNVQDHFMFQNELENINTPRQVIEFLKEEVIECCEALETNDPIQIKGELSDVLIFAATVANSFHFNLQRAILSTEIAPTISLAEGRDLEISRLQQARRESQPQTPGRLQFQEGIDIFLRIDRAEQAHLYGPRERIQPAIGELVLISVDIANTRDIDLQDAVTRKMERNFAKYNPAVARQLITSGLTPLEAYLEQKGSWDRNRDIDYLG